jgi:hypothetical protein
MAAAEALVHAVRTKQVVERSRHAPGGAYGRESPGTREARLAMREDRNREAGKLDDGERGELLFLWSGFDAALGCRSIQGAIYDRLLRSPPHTGMALQDAVEQELIKHGKDGAPRDELLRILIAENVGATSREARMVLRQLADANPPRIELYVAERTTKKPCRCGRLATGVTPAMQACVCGAGKEEKIPTEMVRLVSMRNRRVPTPVERADRWAREDAALEAFAHQLACSESDNVPNGRLPVHVPKEATEAVRAAMRRLMPQDREVIERVYGPMTTPPWAGQLSPEAARLAPLCPSVEKARRELVMATAAARGILPSAARTLDRSIFAADALRWKLDASPDDEVGRIRWKLEGDALKARVEREALALLQVAVKAFRQARG